MTSKFDHGNLHITLQPGYEPNTYEIHGISSIHGARATFTSYQLKALSRWLATVAQELCDTVQHKEFINVMTPNSTPYPNTTDPEAKEFTLNDMGKAYGAGRKDERDRLNLKPRFTQHIHEWNVMAGPFGEIPYCDICGIKKSALL